MASISLANDLACIYYQTVLKDNAMMKYLPAYIATIIFMFIVDLVWLSQLAQPLYQAGIGHLMAANPKLGFAAIFYLVFVFGLIWFAVHPNAQTKGIKPTFIAGALFGFFIYASYDFTNLALLKDWPLKLSIIDMAWGMTLSGVCAAVAKFVFNKTHTI